MIKRYSTFINDSKLNLNCVDCKKDTECFFVKDSIWYDNVPKTKQRGVMCIKCLEKRIGRKLIKSDFQNSEIHTKQSWWASIKDKEILEKFNESKESIDSLCKKYDIKNYTINEDGSIDVDGSVYLIEKSLLVFRNVTGDFSCNSNELTSLEGSPISVGGNFNCSDNQLISLEGAPQSVDGSFTCSDNQLTSLEGSPISVGGNFYCDNNKLTSLEYAPKSLIDYDFSCNHNQLITLEGAPISVGDFSCIFNKLTSLKGAPKSIDRGFDCRNNKLITLEDGPQSVGGNFDCDNNKLLTSLKGAPISIGGLFDCSNNKLTNLIGSPKSVALGFYCENNELITLEGLTESIVDLFCDNNPIAKWWNKIDDLDKLEIFLYMGIYADDPDEVNEEKIKEILEN